MLELDALLHLVHKISGLAQLSELRIGQRLADDVSDAATAEHAWQWKEHILLDAVLTLETYHIIYRKRSTVAAAAYVIIDKTKQAGASFVLC